MHKQRRGLCWHRAIGRVLILLMGIVLFAGRCDQSPDGINIVNEIDQRVEIFYVQDDGKELQVSFIPSGARDSISSGSEFSGRENSHPCTSLPLIAKTKQGEVIARREPPICVGDTWTIREE